MFVRITVVIGLLVLSGTVAAQQTEYDFLVPSFPTTADEVVLHVLLGCEISPYDYVVTRAGETITVTQILDPAVEGCRPTVTSEPVTIGRLPAGHYTLTYVSQGGGRTFTIDFAVGDANVPAVGPIGLGAIGAVIALAGAFLLRRT